MRVVILLPPLLYDEPNDNGLTTTMKRILLKFIFHSVILVSSLSGIITYLAMKSGQNESERAVDHSLSDLPPRANPGEKNKTQAGQFSMRSVLSILPHPMNNTTEVKMKNSTVTYAKENAGKSTSDETATISTSQIPQSLEIKITSKPFPENSSKQFITTLKNNNSEPTSSSSKRQDNNRTSPTKAPEILLSPVNKTSKKDIKIYIYNMSKEVSFTSYCSDYPFSYLSLRSCIDYSNYGMGPFLYRDDGMFVHDTSQFALDVILHQQFLHSKYRTLNASEADIFYIPAYLGLYKRCKNLQISTLIKAMYNDLNAMPYFNLSKPHVISLAKIEKEQVRVISLLPDGDAFTYIVIEKASAVFRKAGKIESRSVIIAPYPSYVHFDYSANDSAYFNILHPLQRRVFMFYAASTRISNIVRAKLMEEITVKTEDDFNNYFNLVNDASDKIMLLTPECGGNHFRTTIEWMQNSVFCMQPHGDSPTRKSFYDSILTGCIPVVFKFPGEKVEFPFERVLNYSTFRVQIPVDNKGLLTNNQTIYDYLRGIPLPVIEKLHVNLKSVMHLLQYPLITKQRDGKWNSALDMIVDEIRAKYNI